MTCEKINSENTGFFGVRYGGDEGHEIAAAEELGDEKSGVALGFWAVNPIQAGPKRAFLTASPSQDSTSVAAHFVSFSGRLLFNFISSESHNFPGSF